MTEILANFQELLLDFRSKAFILIAAIIRLVLRGFMAVCSGVHRTNGNLRKPFFIKNIKMY